MSNIVEVEINCKILIDKEAEIKEGDYFYYAQDNGIPSIRRSKPKEDWNNFFNSKTGETSHFKIVGYKNIIIHI